MTPTPTTLSPTPPAQAAASFQTSDASPVGTFRFA